MGTLVTSVASLGLPLPLPSLCAWDRVLVKENQSCWGGGGRKAPVPRPMAPPPSSPLASPHTKTSSGSYLWILQVTSRFCLPCVDTLSPALWKTTSREAEGALAAGLGTFELGIAGKWPVSGAIG